jgi:hypothetical protein
MFLDSPLFTRDPDNIFTTEVTLTYLIGWQFFEQVATGVVQPQEVTTTSNPTMILLKASVSYACCDWMSQ